MKQFVRSHCPSIFLPLLNSLEASPLCIRIASGTYWSIVGTISARILSLMAFIFVARLIGKREFGEFGMIQSTITLFGSFAGFGLGQTSVKYIAQYRQTDPDKVGRVIVLTNLVALVTSSLACLVLGLLADELATNTLAAPHLATELRVGILVLFVSTLVGVQTGTLAGFEAFRQIAKVNLIVGIISFPLIIFGAFYGGLYGALWGLAFSQIANWIMNHLSIRHKARMLNISFNYSGISKEMHILWFFSIPAMLAGILAGPVNWACNALLVNQPNGYLEMGIYQAANQWFSALLFLPLQLSQVILPVLSERLGQQDIYVSRKIMILSLKINASIVIPIIVIASMGSIPIMGLYGGDFINGWKTFIIILITSGVVAIQTPVGQVLWASAKSWNIFAIDATVGVLFLGLAWIWVGWGSIGLAVARLVAYIVSSILVLGNAFVILRQIENPTVIK